MARTTTKLLALSYFLKLLAHDTLRIIHFVSFPSLSKRNLRNVVDSFDSCLLSRRGAEPWVVIAGSLGLDVVWHAICLMTWREENVMYRKCLIVLLFIFALRGLAEDADRSGATSGSIAGTVVDVNDAIVPGATVALRCEIPCKEDSTVAGDTGSFQFSNLRLGTSYEIAVSASGFKDWTSAPIVLTPERSIFLVSDVKIAMTESTESVTVHASTAEIATEQLHLEEQQRVLGIIPNFYVVYDSKNAVPLPPKLKFQLAMRTALDPVTVTGVAFLSGIQQAGGTPNYAGGPKGYGQRFGANAATGFSDIFIGGAVLPTLLHQDPRYFYQGTGTTSSRLKHALLSPLIARGDNGKPQINFSSLGGDLASSALAETYYPDSNRGPRMIFGNFAIETGERMASTALQEFVLRKLTPGSRKHQNDSEVQ